MKRNINILLLLFVYSFSAMAQVSLPEKVNIFLPDCLKERLIEERNLSKISKENNYGQSSSTGNTMYWDVYSDRSSNAAYNQPKKSSGIATKVEFNQKLRIADIENDFALVYEEPNLNVKHPRISSEAKCIGWIPMENLLLWHSCPANDYGILNKALLVYNLNKSNEGYSFQRYLNPQTKEGATELDYDVTFYFVMKTESNGRVLLAKESSMFGDTDKVLYGWVDAGSYTPWSQRSCLEFNWKYRDFEEGLDGDSVGFFADENYSQTASNYHKYDITTIGKIGKEIRKSGNILRLPILDNMGDKYRITYFAPANGEMSYDEAEELQNRTMEIKNKFVENVKNVNLIIVVDGTQSMKPYFDKLYDAIKNACDKYADEKFKVKLGMVIYRDYKDVLNGDSCYIECFHMTKMNDQKLFNTFKTGGKYGIKSSLHDDYAEVLYEGLYAALDTNAMKYSREASNLIFVVGDCGNRYNDPKSPKADDIKKRIYENNVNIISFQVHNEDSDKSDAWVDYNDQMREFILDNVDRRYKNAEMSGKFVRSQDRKGWDYQVDGGPSFYVASMRSPNLGEDMAVEELERLINDNVLLFTQAINAQIEAANDIFSNYQSTLASGSQKFNIGFLRTRFSEEDMKDMEKRNALLALDGYTPQKNKNGIDYYKPVIFIEHSELVKLVSQFRKVYDATKSSDNRENYINAMKQLLLSMAPDMTPEELNKQGTAFIKKRISGLHEMTEGLNRSFEEIQDPNAVSNEEFEAILNNFRKKFQSLDGILAKKYKYTFNSNNQVYYWIPFDDLP